MTRLVQCALVNDPFSDPGLFIDFCFGRRALLFDLGDLTPLSPRQLFRVSHVFVSHAHMDHFVGFDRLLRVCLHRTMPLHLVGPAGFADRVQHKLKAYTLDLLGEGSCDFVITAAEFNGERVDRRCEFHARETFRQRVWPLRVESRLTQSGPVVDILRSTPKSCCAWPRHPATISPTIFAIRAFDRITGRPDACASCRRCASTNPMQSSSSASAPLRTSETPLAVTTSTVSV